jgi:hypothetical protein
MRNLRETGIWDARCATADKLSAMQTMKNSILRS